MLQTESVSSELLTLLREIQSEDLFTDYILGGGTALALQLGHRRSIDIDLFINKEQNNRIILDFLNNKYSGFNLLNINKNMIELVIKNIKVDFIGTNHNILEQPNCEEDIKFFGKRDIAAMKLQAAVFRNSARDYIDIAYLLQDIPLKLMFELYKQKYNTQDITIIKMALLASKNIEPDHWKKDILMLKNRVDISAISELFEKEIKKYDKTKNIGIKTSVFDIFKNFQRIICKK